MLTKVAGTCTKQQLHAGLGRACAEIGAMMRAQSRASQMVAVVGLASALSLVAACGGEGAPIGADAADDSTAADGSVVLEFSQWWEPELPKGQLRALMDQFEKENAGVKVKLISAPYASTQQQTVAGAASKTLA